MCKQPRDATAVYHILSSYLSLVQHQMSWTDEVWGSTWTSCMLGCLLRERRKAEKVTERKGWKRPPTEETFIHTVARELQWAGEIMLQGVAYLYSQNVSSFMPWDSTSGWRSSFSFTVHKMKRRYQWFPQEMAANEDHFVPWLLCCLNKFESQSLTPCTYSLNERSVQVLEKIAKYPINVFKYI